MEYIKNFNSQDELRAFVNVHKEETGLLFMANQELKTAWIDVDARIYQELRKADR